MDGHEWSVWSCIIFGNVWSCMIIYKSCMILYGHVKSSPVNIGKMENKRVNMIFISCRSSSMKWNFTYGRSKVETLSSKRFSVPMCGTVSCCIVIGPHLWSCSVMCGCHVWSCMVMCGPLWWIMAMYSHVVSYMVMYGPVYLCVVMYCHISGFPIEVGTGGRHSTMEVIPPPLVRSFPPY